MSKMIKYNIFTDLCLICGDFLCEYESYHMKWTLKQVQQLLSQHLQVEVSIENIKNSQKMKELNIHYIFDNTNHVKIIANNIKNIKLIQKKQVYGIQKCVQKIQQCLKSQINQQNSLNQPDFILKSTHIQSILDSIYCMQTLLSRPLIYHDIHQLIILIGMYKWENQKQSNKNKNINQKIIDFPFTRYRVNKTIKYIKGSLEQKKKILEKAMRDKQNKQNYYYHSNDKNSIENYNSLSKNHLNNLNKSNKNSSSQQSSLFPLNPSSFSSSQLISQCLIQSNTFPNIINCLQQIHRHYYFLSSQQLQKHLFRVIFNEINKLQSKVLQAVRKYKNSKNNNNNNNNDNIKQKQNQMFNKMNLQQQKLNNNNQNNITKINKTINLHNNSQLQTQPQPRTLLQKQHQQVIQFISIQGIPFPSNRRCIDFSLFHIDDSLLLSYLPALQKFKDLQQLCLRDNRLSVLGYKFIKNTFPYLRSLDLRDNHLNKQIVEIICEFKQLNILYISDCEINSASLIKICLNLDNVNFLYCDNLKIIEKFITSSSSSLQQQEQNQQQKQNHSNQLDYRNMFYIMCLNMKKLLYFSIKGYFCNNVKNMLRTDCQIIIKSNKNNGEKIIMNNKEIKEINIVKSITDILKKRHGILEI